jgi:predicted PurR-regulated permease PerM
LGDFFRERTARKLLSIAIFLALIVLFREMFALVAMFVAAQAAFSGATHFVQARTKWPRKRSIFAVLATFLVMLGGAVALGATRSLHYMRHARQVFPETLREMEENEIVKRVREHLPDSSKLAERAKEYSEAALHTVSMIGHLAMFALIAVILAIIYTLEEHELHELHDKIDPKSLMGTVLRWLGYVAEAIRITIQLQLVVAAVNTALTLPVLLILGIHHIPSLMILIFVSGLIPVVGNIVSGAVLSLLAYQAKGFVGIGVLVVLTFVLHKIEAYYLNPRLTSKHVHLPGFAIVVSLLCWEHLLGFVGLFVSFPFLFVASKIRGEMINREEPPNSG